MRWFLPESSPEASQITRGTLVFASLGVHVNATNFADANFTMRYGLCLSTFSVSIYLMVAAPYFCLSSSSSSSCTRTHTHIYVRTNPRTHVHLFTNESLTSLIDDYACSFPSVWRNLEDFLSTPEVRSAKFSVCFVTKLLFHCELFVWILIKCVEQRLLRECKLSPEVALHAHARITKYLMKENEPVS